MTITQTDGRTDSQADGRAGEWASGQTVRCGAPRPLASLSFHRRTKNKMKSRFAIHDCQVKNHDPLQFQTIIYPGNGHGGHCFPDPMFSSGTPRRGNKKMPDWLGLHVWFGLLGWLGLFGLLGLLGMLGYARPEVHDSCTVSALCQWR